MITAQVIILMKPAPDIDIHTNMAIPADVGTITISITTSTVMTAGAATTITNTVIPAGTATTTSITSTAIPVDADMIIINITTNTAIPVNVGTIIRNITTSTAIPADADMTTMNIITSTVIPADADMTTMNIITSTVIPADADMTTDSPAPPEAAPILLWSTARLQATQRTVPVNSATPM